MLSHAPHRVPASLRSRARLPGASWRLHAALVSILLALALLVRLWALWSLRFNGLYGQDAYAYYYQGLALWRDHVLSYHWPWLPRPTRFYWPLGEPALVAVAMAIVGHASTGAALAVSILAGLGAVACTYLLARRVAVCVLPVAWTPWVAALAAACIALAGLAVQASDTIMADAPALWWGSAAIVLWTTPARPWRGRRSYLVDGLAGVCFALAVSTRFEYAPLAVAMALYWLARRTGRAAPSAVAALAGAAIAGAPQALYTLSYSDPVLHQQWLTTWSIAHLWQSDFATADGVQRYSMSAGLFYLLRPLVSPQSLPFMLAPFLPAGIAALSIAPRNAPTCMGVPRNCGPAGSAGVSPAGVPGGKFPSADLVAPDEAGETPALPGGLCAIHNSQARPTRTMQHARDPRPLLLLLLAWWLAPALYLSGVPFESARFALIYAPPLAILEAVGLAAALRWWPAPRRPYVAAVVLAALSLATLAADARGPLAALARGKAGDLAAVRWLDGHAPHDAAIATFSLTLTLYHEGDLQSHRWTLRDLSAVTAADLRRLARARPLVVVANEANLATQWPGLPPETALRWLLGHAQLRPVAAIGGYAIRERR